MGEPLELSFPSCTMEIMTPTSLGVAGTEMITAHTQPRQDLQSPWELALGGQCISSNSISTTQHNTWCLLYMKCWAKRRPSPLPATGSSEDPASEYRLPLLPFPVTLQAAQLHSPNGCHFILHLNVHGGVGAHLNGGKKTMFFPCSRAENWC